MDNNLTPDQIKQMIIMLQGMLPQENAEEDEEEKIHNPIKTKTRKRKTKQVFENKFLDMQEMHLHKSDSTIDKKLKVSPLTPRRDPVKLVKVCCRVCGRKEEVSPSMITESDRYKCNKCCGSAG